MNNSVEILHFLNRNPNGVRAKEVANFFIPDGVIWRRGAGQGAWLTAGRWLSALEKKGLVTRKRTDIYLYVITAAGRDFIFSD